MEGKAKMNSPAKSNETTIPQMIINGLKSVEDYNVSKSADDRNEKFYDDGWGFHDVTEDEYNALIHREPEEIVALNDEAHDDDDEGAVVDTFIGFNDDTVYKIHGYSIWDIIHPFTGLPYVND